MTIPFLSLFKRDKSDASKAKDRAVAPAPPPLEKPSSERFSKTVMPNATRTIAPQDQFQTAARSSNGGSARPAAPASNTPTAPRTILFGTSAGQSQALPPAVALALEPRVERVIALEVADIAAQLPAGYCKPLQAIDGTRRVLLKAAEVERGMASGRPAVSLASVYQQVPEIFERAVEPTDTAQVALPFAKVLEQFAALQVRSDQVRLHAVPQVETPFLKVTLEDNERFGTSMPELETGDLPPVRVEPPTAEAFAAAEPEASSSETTSWPRPAAATNGAAPTRIPFRLSPNGTDVPATESVPASAGPSVPSGAVAPAPAPTRIPFKIAPPSDDARPKPEPWLTAATPEFGGESIAGPAKTGAEKELTIALPLKPILQALPAFQLSGDPESVPDDVRIELPFSLVEPQLATGRIMIAPKVFQESVPVNFRGICKADAAATDISLPLQDVLKNIPSASLRMRDDQIEQEAGSNFATPFSAKAEEDAKRFNVAGTPVAKPALEVEATPKPSSGGDDGSAQASTSSGDRPLRTPLQVALETDDKLDAKGVVAHVNKMAGVKACAIMFGDGLSLAGTLPPEFEADGLCAMAPSLFQRIGNHMVETRLGAFRDMTLSCTKAAVTFFMHDNLCLAALHANNGLATEVHEKLGRVVHELSRKYSHPV